MHPMIRFLKLAALALILSIAGINLWRSSPEVLVRIASSSIAIILGLAAVHYLSQRVMLVAASALFIPLLLAKGDLVFIAVQLSLLLGFGELVSSLKLYQQVSDETVLGEDQNVSQHFQRAVQRYALGFSVTIIILTVLVSFAAQAASSGLLRLGHLDSLSALATFATAGLLLLGYLMRRV